MRNLRKALSALSVVAILSSLVVTTAFAGTFTDVADDAYYAEAVEALAEQGVLNADADNYNPGMNTARDVAAKLVVLGMGYDLENPETPTFSDVPKTNWAYQYIETAAA